MSSSRKSRSMEAAPGRMLLLHCRAGFEADCAAELSAAAHAAGSEGRCQYTSGSAHVLWLPASRSVSAASRPGGTGRKPGPAGASGWVPDYADLVFARQLVTRCQRFDGLSSSERVAAIVEAARRFGGRYAAICIEAPDDAPGRERLAALRSLAEPVEAQLRDAGMLAGERRGRRLHVCFVDDASVVLGTSEPDNASPWPMGIPRLRFPAGAPSRSALKLIEALETFIGAERLPERMRAGRAAVDLGAAPGGWSYVLASRGLRVYAVDNGPLADSVLATQLVEHRREDAFRFRPQRPVDWLTCDVVAAPARIAALVAQWFSRGWCREAIFNLKLPNRDRWQEVQRCHGVIEKALAKVEGDHTLAIKHLYHDREEVTGYLRRL